MTIERNNSMTNTIIYVCSIHNIQKERDLPAASPRLIIVFAIKVMIFIHLDMSSSLTIDPKPSHPSCPNQPILITHGYLFIHNVETK